MEIELRCRLKAYAKLSVNGSGSADDTFKKIQEGQYNTLINLGYTNSEGDPVFAIKRSFDHTFTFSSEGFGATVSIANNIKGIVSFGGDVIVDGGDRMRGAERFRKV